MEKKYQFKEKLLQIHQKERRDFSLVSCIDELEIKNGFSIVVPESGRRPNETKAMFGSSIYFPKDNPEITGRNSPTGVRIKEEIKQNKIMAELMEKENVLATIPLVEFDSRLGWEPSMEHTTDADGLQWKLRQLEHELNYVLPIFRKSSNLINEVR